MDCAGQLSCASGIRQRYNTRMSRSTAFALASSLILLAALAGALYFSQPDTEKRPLIVYCAAALKPAAEATATAFTAETGQPVEFRFGNSETILQNAEFSRDGDLLLPADDSYIRAARARGLIAESQPLARMRAVVLVRSGNPHHIATFDDLLKPGFSVGQANPDGAAIGHVTRAHLQSLGRWDELAARTNVLHTTVTETANAVQLGGNDAGIVWDAVAANYPELVVVRLPELEGAVGRVEIAVLNTSSKPEAARKFVRYFQAADRGMSHLEAAGFTDRLPGPAWGQP